MGKVPNDWKISNVKPGKHGAVGKYSLGSLTEVSGKIIWRGMQSLAAGTKQAHGTVPLASDKVGSQPHWGDMWAAR